MTGRESRQPSRRHPRYLLDTEIRVLAGVQSEPVRSRTLDISESGIAGIFHTNWNVGDFAVLHFAIPPSHEVLQTSAVVRSRAGTRYGFEFINVTGDCRAAIQNACRVLAGTH